MMRTLPLVLALTMGLAAWAQAQAPERSAGGFPEGTPVVVVGEISSQPKDIVNERKMQVAIGPGKVDYTLHLSDASLFGYHGQKLGADDLDDKMWVRAEGKVMDDPRRIKVTRLQVVGKDLPSLKQSAFYRPGFDQGYVMAVAGSRQVFPATPTAIFAPAPMVVVGKVSDDTGTSNKTRKIQVDAAGNTWTLHVPDDAMVRDARDKKISVHEIHKGQWVRAHGWRTGDLRMRVERLENVGAQEAFRASTFYRTEFPFGYVDPVAGADAFSPFAMSGSVTRIDPVFGTIHVRDAGGNERIIYTDSATIKRGDETVYIDTIRVGDSVSIEGRTIRFK